MGLAVVQRVMCRTVPLSALNVSQRHTGLSGYTLCSWQNRMGFMRTVFRFAFLNFRTYCRYHVGPCVCTYLYVR